MDLRVAGMLSMYWDLGRGDSSREEAPEVYRKGRNVYRSEICGAIMFANWRGGGSGAETHAQGCCTGPRQQLPGDFA